MTELPNEIAIGGLYYPPLLFVGLFALLLAMGISWILNRFNLSQYVWHPPLFFIAAIVFCGCLVSLFVIPI